MNKKINLSIFCIHFITYFIMFFPVIAEGVAANQDVSSEVKQETDNQPVIKRPQVEYKASSFNDPFITVIKKPEVVVNAENVVAPDLLVKGLVWGGNQPIAIINNKVLKLGDKIEGAEVIKIGNAGVDIIYSGKVFHFDAPAGIQKKQIIDK